MVRTMVSCICSLKTIELELVPHDIPMIYLFLLVETPSLSNHCFSNEISLGTQCLRRAIFSPPRCDSVPSQKGSLPLAVRTLPEWMGIHI